MILSVSRRTDIPAFYSSWFLNRLRAGEVLVRNPMNERQVSRIELRPDAVDCIVFWTKDAGPILSKLPVLDDLGYKYYFLYTVNPYGKELEPGFADPVERIESFKKLSDMIGPDRVIWRYDPVIVSGEMDRNYHHKKFKYLSSEFTGYTNRCIFSFLTEYRKIIPQMRKIGVLSPDDLLKREISSELRFTAPPGMKLAVCAPNFDISDLDIESGSCIDKKLVDELAGKSIKIKKDPSQRKSCGCIESKDIGAYNSCTGGCLYCYANNDNKTALKKAQSHDPAAPMLCDELRGNEVITHYKKYKVLQDKNIQRDLF